MPDTPTAVLGPLRRTAHVRYLRWCDRAISLTIALRWRTDQCPQPLLTDDHGLAKLDDAKCALRVKLGREQVQQSRSALPPEAVFANGHHRVCYDGNG